MKRTLRLALGLTAVLIGHPARALELGALQTESALNQPFLGFIELGDVRPDELDTLRIALAPPEAFAKAGIERYYYLTHLRFAPEATPDGRVQVRVTSREPMREPYLDFLVEAVWPGGKLIKGYTVLLDPPTQRERRAPAVQTARAASVSQVPRPGVTPTATQTTGEYLPAPGEGFPLYIGPVKPGEGLWALARRHAPPGATVAQTALALYRCNQGAFARGNINRLIAGKTLVIPSRDELFALDAETAWREFQAALKGRPTQRAPLTPVTPEMLARLRLVGVSAPSAQVPVQAEQPGQPAISPATPSTAPSDVLQAIETSETARREADALRQRIQELESQLAAIQDQLKNRDAELSRLQPVVQPPSVTAEASLSSEPQVQPPPTTPASAEEEPVPEPEAEAETAAQPGALTEPAPPEAASGEGEQTGPPPAGLIPLPEVEPKAPATPVVQPQPAPAESTSPSSAQAPSQPAPQPPPIPTSSTWHDLLLPIAGLAAVTALGVLLFSRMSARRKRAQVEEEEEGLTLDQVSPEKSEPEPAKGPEPAVSLAKGPTPQPQEAAQAAPEASAPALEKDEKEGIEPVSVLTDFDIETDEADVLSEADIYIAYGRYQEARDLLNKEIKRHPQRLDLRYKLAEALAAAGERDAMQSLLDEIKSLGGDVKDPAQWERLQRLWRESTPTIVEQRPGRPTQTPSAPGVELPTAAPPPSPSAPGLEQPPSQPTSRSDELILDLSESLGLGETGESKPDEELLAALQTPPPRQGPAPAVAPSLEEDLDEILPAIEAGKADLTLPEIDLDLLGKKAEGPAEQAEPSIAIDSTLGPERESVPSDLLSSQWQVDSGIWDEVATKLDLARAYIEMNDKEAAREILEEVLNEGREEQRQEAKALLERLARLG